MFSGWWSFQAAALHEMPDEEFLASLRTVPASKRHWDTVGAITQCRRGGADVLGRCDQSTILRVQKGKKKVLVFSKYLFWRCFYANLKFGTLTFVELLKKSAKGWSCSMLIALGAALWAAYLGWWHRVVLCLQDWTGGRGTGTYWDCVFLRLDQLQSSPLSS